MTLTGDSGTPVSNSYIAKMASDNKKFVSSWNEELPKSDYDNFQFQVNAELSKIQTAIPVKVLAVNATGVAPVGFVDCQPLVTQLTVSGQPVSQGTITNLPYMRLQGGENAVVIDPSVGDIGLAIFASRDVSGVKNARKESPPSSRRQYSLNDGFYVGGFLNKAPKQYIFFKQDGIVIHTPTKVTIEAPEKVVMDTPLLEIHGRMVMTGQKGSGASTSGGISNTGGTIESNGIVLETHVHRGVTSGGSNTGEPV